MRSAAGSAVDELPGAGVDEHKVEACASRDAARWSMGRYQRTRQADDPAEPRLLRPGVGLDDFSEDRLQHRSSRRLPQGELFALGTADLRAIPWKRIQQNRSGLRQPTGRHRANRWAKRRVHKLSAGKDENTGEDDSGANAGPFARHKVSTQMST